MYFTLLPKYKKLCWSHIIYGLRTKWVFLYVYCCGCMQYMTLKQSRSICHPSIFSPIQGHWWRGPGEGVSIQAEIEWEAVYTQRSCLPARLSTVWGSRPVGGRPWELANFKLMQLQGAKFAMTSLRRPHLTPLAVSASAVHDSVSTNLMTIMKAAQGKWRGVILLGVKKKKEKRQKSS